MGHDKARPSDAVIGHRLFADGAERDVFRGDDGQQYVIGPDGEQVRGVWLLTPELMEDAPIIVQARPC